MMRVLLERGYGVSFIPAHREVGPSYVAAVRELGVHVLPRAPPDKWVLQEGGGGRCLYDAVLVARRSIFESCRDVLKQKCPGARVIYDTGAPPSVAPGFQIVICDFPLRPLCSFDATSSAPKKREPGVAEPSRLRACEITVAGGLQSPGLATQPHCPARPPRL